jgi:hypothetical protein
MLGYDLLVLLHVLLFVYWLGGDLGVFYSSRYLTKPELPPATRATVLKILLFIDMAPRVCLISMLPVGFTLAYWQGWVALPGWGLALIWLGGLAWLWLAITLYIREHDPAIKPLTTFDWWLRVGVIAALILLGVWALVGSDPWITQPWLSLKLIVMGLIIFCGLMIRVTFKPFGPAFGALMRTGSTPEVEQAMAASLSASRTWVVLLWIGLLIMAFLGIHKPFF